MGIDGDDESKEDDEEESDEEVWDDEQMLKVDEQLAEVFRQRANADKSKDFKSGSRLGLIHVGTLTKQTCTSNLYISRLGSLISSRSLSESRLPTQSYFT